MAAYHVVPLRAFADNYIWTIRDERCAVVVDPGDAQPVIEYLDREKLLQAKEVVEEINRHKWLQSEMVGYDVGLPSIKPNLP